MSCFLCGHEEEDRHHLGCARISRPNLTRKVAEEEGLIAPESKPDGPPKPKTEVLKEGTMTTVPEEDVEDEEVLEVSTCEYEGCDNPKYSDSPRAKWCEDHKDPKSRKE